MTLREKTFRKTESAGRKILLVRLSSLGDIIHVLPAQQELARHFPAAEIHWLTEPPYEALLQAVPGVRRVWLADTRRWRRQPTSWRQGLSLLAQLRRQHFDMALDFQGLLKSAVLARLSGARRVVGFQPERFKESAARHFYTHRVRGDNGSRPHVIDINLQLIRFLGCPVNGWTPRISLALPRKAIEYVETQLRRRGVRRPVLLNPGAGWVTKRWPAECFAELHRRLRRQLGLPVVLTYGPDETPLLEAVRTAAAPEPILAFPTDMLQLAALCQRARLMIAGDTGPLHLAVAVGTPTVAIMGPTSPWRNGPAHPEDEVVHRELLCSHSYRRTCDRFICMNIPVDSVLEAVVRRLSS